MYIKVKIINIFNHQRWVIQLSKESLRRITIRAFLFQNNYTSSLSELLGELRGIEYQNIFLYFLKTNIVSAL